MNRAFLAAGIVAVGCSAPMGAHAQSCPAGQIYRVSMGVCQPRSSENKQWLKNGEGKPALKPSAGRPAVGDVVLFGESAPMLLKPVAPRSATRATAPKRAIAKAPVSRSPASRSPVSKEPVSRAVATVAQPAEEAPELRKQETEFTTQRNASLKVEDAKVPEAKQPELVPATAAPRAASQDAPVAKQDPPVAQQEAPVVKEQAPPPVVAAPMQPNAAPSAAIEQPRETATSMAAIQPPRQVRTIPLYQTPTSNPPAVNSSAPDWGDENKLVEVLRAAWKEKAVTRTFRRGEEVPADLPLQQLPASFASRDAGVNMHYLIANGDAVLVLPGMRVVVEVYHSSTASLQ